MLDLLSLPPLTLVVFTGGVSGVPPLNHPIEKGKMKIWREGITRHDNTGQDKQDKTRQEETRQDNTGKGNTTQHNTRLGEHLSSFYLAFYLEFRSTLSLAPSLAPLFPAPA
jgi:hypothetical protein